MSASCLWERERAKKNKAEEIILFTIIKMLCCELQPDEILTKNTSKETVYIYRQN